MEEAVDTTAQPGLDLGTLLKCFGRGLRYPVQMELCLGDVQTHTGRVHVKQNRMAFSAELNNIYISLHVKNTFNSFFSPPVLIETLFFCNF